MPTIVNTILVVCAAVMVLCAIWLVVRGAKNVPEKLSELEFGVAAMSILMSSLLVLWVVIGVVTQSPQKKEVTQSSHPQIDCKRTRKVPARFP